jgi:hypothetical protein
MSRKPSTTNVNGNKGGATPTRGRLNDSNIVIASASTNSRTAVASKNLTERKTPENKTQTRLQSKAGVKVDPEALKN